MRLRIENIGRVGKADIALNGITVIAGENNTGKSTVGKALFAVFNSFYNRKEKILSEIVNALEKELQDFFFPSLSLKLTSKYSLERQKIQEKVDEAIDNIIMNYEQYVEYKNELQDYLYSVFEEIHSKPSDEELSIDDIVDVLEISDEEILTGILQRQLDLAFREQINNIYATQKKGNIVLTIQEKDLTVQIKDQEVKSFSGSFNLKTEAIYIDNPFILDDLELYEWAYETGTVIEEEHSSLLAKKLIEGNATNKSIVKGIVTNKRLENLLQKINAISPGIIVKTNRKFAYKEKNSKKLLNIKNLSAGLKSFATIKELLQSGSLEKNGTLILDEPEVHLHPHWQLLFAEIIVLLHKEFDVHILINTHSPYFLEAIEVYASHYQIEENCNYYLAENNPSSHGVFTITDVTNETERIYEKLARPLQDLENLRYAND